MLKLAASPQTPTPLLLGGVVHINPGSIQDVKVGDLSRDADPLGPDPKMLKGSSVRGLRPSGAPAPPALQPSESTKINSFEEERLVVFPDS